MSAKIRSGKYYKYLAIVYLLIIRNINFPSVWYDFVSIFLPVNVVVEMDTLKSENDMELLSSIVLFVWFDTVLYDTYTRCYHGWASLFQKIKIAQI